MLQAPGLVKGAVEATSGGPLLDVAGRLAQLREARIDDRGEPGGGGRLSGALLAGQQRHRVRDPGNRGGDEDGQHERLVALGDVQRLPQLAEISVADRFGEGPGQLGAAEPHRRGVHNSSAGFAAAKW